MKLCSMPRRVGCSPDEQRRARVWQGPHARLRMNAPTPLCRQ